MLNFLLSNNYKNNKTVFLRCLYKELSSLIFSFLLVLHLFLWLWFNFCTWKRKCRPCEGNGKLFT